MMVLLGYFLMAAIAGVAASAIIGFVLTNLLSGRFEKADRLSEFHQIRANNRAYQGFFNLDLTTAEDSKRALYIQRLYWIFSLASG